MNQKPILIAANKADLCNDLSIVEKISESKVILCSAETELILKKASKSGLVHYVPGADQFQINDESDVKPEQQKALGFVFLST